MKRMHRIVAIVILFTLVVISAVANISISVSALDGATIAATTSGTCGTGVYWEYFEDTQTLYIHGNGSITGAPWDSFKDNIKEIIVGNDIISICQGAFYGCSKLEKITLPFIGGSQTATDHQAVFGFVFDYETIYFADLWLYEISSQYSYAGYHRGDVWISSSNGKTLEEGISPTWGESTANTKLQQLAQSFVNGSARVSGTRSNAFANGKVSFAKGYVENTTWQYSSYSGGYLRLSKQYGLKSYYYYIPSTLKTVTITNADNIPNAAFNGCENIDTIDFYSNITSTGTYAFQNCEADINYIDDTSSQKYTYTNGLDTFTYSVQKGSATIVSCTTTNEAVIIPDYIDDYPVTTIGCRAFSNNTNVKSVILSSNTTKVDSYAFYNCENLENVTLGSKLEEIGDYAFYNTALPKITAPASLRTIGDCAFANCSTLTKFTMRSGVESLGYGVFYNATQLSDVTLSNTIYAISDFCFYNCSALTEIKLPASIVTIGNCAFEKCTNLNVATIEGNVEYIGQKAFYSCNLSNFDFGNKITYLGANSFSLNPITTVDLPNTITQIGAQAFSDCQLLSDIYLPDSVILGENALHNNASNLTVTIHYNTGIIPNKMLYKNKMSIVVIENGITDIGEYAFAECTDLMGITFPETLKNIGNYAFYKSKLSADTTLPPKVTTIGNYAFSEASALTKISVPDSIQKIGTGAFDSSINVNIYYRFGEICADLFKGQYIKSIFVDDEIHSIGNNAFANCTNLVELSLPDTISTVGSGCFASSNNIILTIRTVDGKIDNEVFRGKLSNISTVILDNSNIGDYAFADNAKLKNVSISATSGIATMTIIGDHSFEGCTSLGKLVIPPTVNNIGSHAFYGCTSLTSVNIPNGVTEIKPYTFYNCSSLMSIILPPTIASIGEYAFYECDDMVSINIQSGIKTIPDYAFYGCESLETIKIPDTVISIGNYSFCGCIAMLSADISSQCTSIGDYAFYNCKTLASLELPDSLKNIGDHAFSSCIKLTNIILEDTVESLGDSVFYNCTGLLSISFGKGITALPSQVLGGCYNLEGMYIYAPLSYIHELAFYGANNVTAYIGNDQYMIDYFDDNAISYVIMDNYEYQYKVIFKNENGDIISSNLYNRGEMPSIPETPLKAPNLIYQYVFSGWDNEVTAVSKNIVYTAVFDEMFVEYTIIFKNEDGTILSEETYHYGDSIEIPSTPVKPNDNIYTYTFSGWNNVITTCLGSAIYTATYEAEFIDYLVVFYNYDRTVISSNTYHYGEAVSIPANPTRTTDKIGLYTFEGWDKIVTQMCDGNAEYVATYNIEYTYYTVTFKDYDGTVLSSLVYHYGDTVVIPNNPQRKKDAIYTYAFSNWDKTITKCEDNTTYTAVYKATYIEYMVVFKDWNGAIISSDKYHYGQSVVLPSNPVRASNETYTYTFKDWGKTVAETCVGDAEYTAVYTATYIEYNIRFLDWDGSLIQTVKYHYGETITAIADPERESDETYTYTFLSWNKELGTCTGNASFTAQYESTYINYTVVFKDYDGSVISRKTYHFGDPITIPADPVRASDDTYSYTFKNWGGISTSCNGDKEYTAVYNAEYIDYTVIFKDHDGSVISTQTYHFGDTVTAPQNPTRAADNTYTYAFAGWNKTVVACDGDATYTATYTPTFIDYTVEFKDYDGEVISTGTYHYGDAITVPTAPTRESDAIGSYTFKAWDNTVVNCAGDAIYTATYEITYTDYTVIFKNEDGTVLSTETYHYGDAVTAPTTPTKAADNTYTYTFKVWDKTVVDCAGDAIYTATYDSAYIDYTVTFKNEDGTVLSTETYHYGDAVTVPTAPTKDADNTYTYTFKAWDAEVVACAGDATYTATYDSAYIDYTVIFKNEDGTVLSTNTYHYGDVVTAPTTPTKDADNTYTYTFKAWDAEVVACAGDATYTATYDSAYIDYTVIFKDEDGTVLSTETYHYGDAVTAPTTPTKESDGEYTYTFNGWDKEIVACAGDAIYTATYTATEIEDTTTSETDTEPSTNTNQSIDSGTSNDNSDAEKKSGCAGLIGGTSAVVITVACAGGALLLKKKKRK